MIEVEIVQSCSGIGFSYAATDRVMVTPEQAESFIRHGLAVAVKLQKARPETATQKTPKAETRPA